MKNNKNIFDLQLFADEETGVTGSIPTPAADNSANSVSDTQKTDIDYKAEYEKMKRLKDQYSKESSEWKNKYNSTLSEAEQSRIASEEREKHYQEIERAYNLNKIASGLSKNISDDKVVNDIAGKLLDGNHLGAVEDLNKYLSAHDEVVKKQVTETLLKDNPTPPPTGANTESVMTQEKFDRLGYKERIAFKEKYPEEYKKLAK